jgi:hypothetical protein
MGGATHPEKDCGPGETAVGDHLFEFGIDGRRPHATMAKDVENRSMFNGFVELPPFVRHPH